MTSAAVSRQPITILVADDDEEDRDLALRALKVARLANDVRFVRDGDELMEYLERRGRYATPGSAPRPGLLLLDLRMPKRDGFDCLRAVRLDPALRRIPVVILTTSRAEEDILRGYDLGVNSFISKPVTFGGLVEAMQVLGRYWFEIVELPVRPAAAPAVS
jgi:two-component system, response regulator